MRGVGEAHCPESEGEVLSWNNVLMKNPVHLRSRFVGGMIGTAVGDAIGELAFRHPRRDALLREVESQQSLAYTDDTAMAVALAESIIRVGGIDQQHLGDTFWASYVREPWRGYASGPPTVFWRAQDMGMPYAAAARTLYGGEGSFGNGAAMRVAPLGLVFHDAPALYDEARLSATVTHAHPIGIDGAAVQARAVAEAVRSERRGGVSVDDFVGALLDTARTSEMKGKLECVQSLVREGASPRRAAMVLGQDVAVHRSLPFAVYCFLSHPDSFENCLFCAILNGGDRDTLGAMACAISGAYLGVEAVPARWRERLENRERIEELAVELVAMAISTAEDPGASAGPDAGPAV